MRCTLGDTQLDVAAARAAKIVSLHMLDRVLVAPLFAKFLHAVGPFLRLLYQGQGRRHRLLSVVHNPMPGSGVPIQDFLYGL